VSFTVNPVGTANVTVQYWLNEQGHIALTSGTGASITAGQTLTIAAQGTDYTDQQWFVVGVEDTSRAGLPSYIFTGAEKGAGKYAVGLQVQKDNAYYYAEFIVTVQ
jgi:hypothetical protein